MGDTTLISAINIIGPPDLAAALRVTLSCLPNELLKLIAELPVSFCTQIRATCPADSIPVPLQLRQLRIPFVLQLTPSDLEGQYAVTIYPIAPSTSGVALIRHSYPEYSNLHRFLSDLANTIALALAKKPAAFQRATLKKLQEINIQCSTQDTLIVMPRFMTPPSTKIDLAHLGQECTLTPTHFPHDTIGVFTAHCETQLPEYILSLPNGASLPDKIMTIAHNALNQQCTLSTNDQPVNKQPMKATPTTQHENSTWFGMTLLVSFSMSFLSEIIKTIRFNNKKSAGKLLNLFLDYSNYIVLIGLFYAMPTSTLLWVTTHLFNTFLKKQISSKVKKKLSEFLVFAITQLLINYTHQKETDFKAALMILVTFGELVLGDTAGYYLARATTTFLKNNKKKSAQSAPKKNANLRKHKKHKKPAEPPKPANLSAPKPTTNTAPEDATLQDLETYAPPRKNRKKKKKPTTKQTATSEHEPVAEAILEPEPTPAVIEQREVALIPAKPADPDDEDNDAQSDNSDDTQETEENSAATADPNTQDTAAAKLPVTITITKNTTDVITLHCHGDTQDRGFITQLMESMPDNPYTQVIIDIDNPHIPPHSKLSQLFAQLEQEHMPGSITGGAALQIIECLLGIRTDEELKPNDLDCLLSKWELRKVMRYHEKKPTKPTIRPYKETYYQRDSYDFQFHGLPPLQASIYTSITGKNPPSDEALAEEIRDQSRQRHTSTKSCIVLIPSTNNGRLKLVLPNITTLLDIAKREFCFTPHATLQAKWVFMALAMQCEGYKQRDNLTERICEGARSNLEGFARFHCLTRYLLRYGSAYLTRLAKLEIINQENNKEPLLYSFITLRQNFDYTNSSYSGFFDQLIAIANRCEEPKNQYTALLIALITPQLFNCEIFTPKHQALIHGYVHDQLTALGLRAFKQDLPAHIIPVQAAATQCIELCTGGISRDPLLLEIQKLLQSYLDKNRPHPINSAAPVADAAQAPKTKKILFFTDPQASQPDPQASQPDPQASQPDPAASQPDPAASAPSPFRSP